MTLAQLDEMVPNGKAEAYAWPGGYPIYYVTSDGGVLCPPCVTKEYERIRESSLDNARDGWALDGRGVNYEDPDLYCDHCSQRIESAYAEDGN